MEQSPESHAPLPWRVGDRTPYVEIWGRMRMNSYPILASMEHEPREANAAFIVRACNAYDDLLAACKHALTVAIEYDETGFAGTIVLKKMLREAIAKADPRTATDQSNAPGTAQPQSQSDQRAEGDGT